MTHPSPDRFAGIALTLGTTVAELERRAARRTAATKPDREYLQLSPKERLERVNKEVHRRTGLIEQASTRYNAAHDHARDQFFMPFVECAVNITQAPKAVPSLDELEGLDDPDQPLPEKTRNQMRVASNGIRSAIVGGTGGAAMGAALGTAASYGAFTTAAMLGTASTGAAISSLSGVAATNATLAVLGGGTLAAGGAGIAGGTALLAGVVAAPAGVLALGGAYLLHRRASAKRDEQIRQQLAEIEPSLDAGAEAFEATLRHLDRAERLLHDIAVHGGRAVSRWTSSLGPAPICWGDLDDRDKSTYDDFISICAAQLAAVSIDVAGLISSRGPDVDRLAAQAETVLTEAEAAVNSRI